MFFNDMYNEYRIKSNIARDYCCILCIDMILPRVLTTILHSWYSSLPQKVLGGRSCGTLIFAAQLREREQQQERCWEEHGWCWFRYSWWQLPQAPTGWRHSAAGSLGSWPAWEGTRSAAPMGVGGRWWRLYCFQAHAPTHASQWEACKQNSTKHPPLDGGFLHKSIALMNKRQISSCANRFQKQLESKIMISTYV